MTLLPLLVKRREIGFYEGRCDRCASPIDATFRHAADHRSAPSLGECPRCGLPFAPLER
jgi:hypothetical protein